MTDQIKQLEERLRSGGLKGSMEDQAADLIKRLSAENEELKRDAERIEWQPIETAPKGAHGISFMLLSCGPEDDKTSAYGMRIDDEYYASCIYYRIGNARKPFEFRETKVSPTHWMPLPNPPAIAAKGEVK